MKGWKINKPFSLIDTEIEESVVNNNQSKIRITKALITLSDVLRFNGELETDEIVLGSNGLGVVTETEPNLFGLEKGKRVFVESVRCCETCYNCKKGDKDKKAEDDPTDQKNGAEALKNSLGKGFHKCWL